jgi:hypothetical protein
MNSLLKVLVACLILVSSSTAMAASDAKWTFGTEFDLVPFLLDGYYVSAIAGKGRLRGRLVRTVLTTPGFATDDAFEDNDLAVTALIMDVYFKDGFSGWWLGPGLERWDGDVTEKSSGVRMGYVTKIFTVGGGYEWKFSKHFYLNPWAAVHVPIGGDRSVDFPSAEFTIDPTLEASVKFGIEF